MGFVPSQIGFICPKEKELVSWDGDASISVWATLHNVKKFVVAHNDNFLRPQIVGKQNLSLVNALCLNKNTKKKRKFAYSKISKWETLGN